MFTYTAIMSRSPYLFLKTQLRYLFLQRALLKPQGRSQVTSLLSCFHFIPREQPCKLSGPMYAGQEEGLCLPYSRCMLSKKHAMMLIPLGTQLSKPTHSVTGLLVAPNFPPPPLRINARPTVFVSLIQSFPSHK